MHRSDTSLKKRIITFPLNSFHFISSLYVFPLLFFKALLSELTNKLKYHCTLMTDISPTPFFYGLIKFCDPKGQWNTIIIHRRATKLYTTLFQLERCWLFVAPSSIKLMFPVYSWKKTTTTNNNASLSSRYLQISRSKPVQTTLQVKQVACVIDGPLLGKHTCTTVNPPNIHKERQAQDRKSKLQSWGQANTVSSQNIPVGGQWPNWKSGKQHRSWP